MSKGWEIVRYWIYREAKRQIELEEVEREVESIIEGIPQEIVTGDEPRGQMLLDL